MEVIELGVPIDVLWFHISRKNTDPEMSLGNVNYGKVLVLINRSEYFQAGLIIPKGSFEQLRQNGLAAFQQEISRIAPWLGDRVSELKDWRQIKLLIRQINRLKQWHRPGLLCIGDAAHAMSPAGGVGINLAIQDAVATTNLLAKPLREQSVTEDARSGAETAGVSRARHTTHADRRPQGNSRSLSQSRSAKLTLATKTDRKSTRYSGLLARVVGMGISPRTRAAQSH